MGGGSKSTSKTELPAWYSAYAKRALALGDKIAQVGDTHYKGPDIASFNPQQVAGMQNAADWFAAFGGKGAKAVDVRKNLPKDRAYGTNNIRGLSSHNLYSEAMDTFKKENPGQWNYIKGFSIDPKTGEPAPMYKDLKPLDGGGGSKRGNPNNDNDGPNGDPGGKGGQGGGGNATESMYNMAMNPASPVSRPRPLAPRPPPPPAPPAPPAPVNSMAPMGGMVPMGGMAPMNMPPMPYNPSVMPYDPGYSVSIKRIPRRPGLFSKF